MKALEKDRARRYESATGFAMDLNRFLTHEPVAARPPSTAYKFQKLVRRNRMAFAAGSAVMTALVLGMIASAWLAARARLEAVRARKAEAVASEKSALAVQERERADQSEFRTRKHLYAADMDLAFRALESRNFSHARELIEKHRSPATTGRESGIEQELRGWEWRYMWGQTRVTAEQLPGNKDRGGALFVSFSPDGRFLASSHSEGGFNVWEFKTRREVFSTSLQPSRLHCFAWFPDSRFLVLGNFEGSVIRWDQRTGQMEDLFSIEGRIWHLAFSPDGAVLALAGEKAVQLMDWTQKKEIARFEYKAPLSPRRVAFSPDGQTLAIAHGGPVVQLWHWRRDGQQARLGAELSAAPYGEMITDLRYSPDGRFLAVAGRDAACTVWEAATGRTLGILTHQNAWGVSGVDFSPDGQTLATASEDQTIRLWEVATWRETAVMPNSSGSVGNGRFAPDGSALVTGDEHGSVKVWPLPPSSRRLESYRVTMENVHQADLWPEEGLLSFATETPTNALWRVWDLRTMKEIYAQPSAGNVLAWEPWRAFAPAQRRSLEYTRERALQFRHVPSGSAEPFVSCDLGSGTAGENDSIRLAMSGNGRFAAAAGLGRIHVWDVAAKVKLHEIKTFTGAYQRGILISPEGKSLIARGHQLTHWRLETGETRILPGSFNNVFKFLSDGRLAAADEDGSVAVHDLATGAASFSFNGGYRRYCDLTLSADGKRLVLAGWAGLIQFWDLGSQRQIAVVRASENQRFGASVGFVDENTMVSVFAGELRIWRAPSWAEIELEMPRDQALKKQEISK